LTILDWSRAAREVSNDAHSKRKLTSINYLPAGAGGVFAKAQLAASRARSIEVLAGRD
jgi:hypothetical protein